MQTIQLANLDVDGLRTRLRKMSDDQLRSFGNAARYLHDGKMPSPQVFAEAMAKVRQEYVPTVRKLREQQKEK